jgi:hypothetical protein
MLLPKNLFFFILLIWAMNAAQAQDTRPAREKKQLEKTEWKEQVYYGGNLGLQFNGNGSLIDISPNAGYKFNKIISTGPQLIFTNLNYKSQAFTYRYTFYGGGAFVRAQAFPWLFLQAEYDLLSVPNAFSIIDNKRVLADVALAGVGIRNQLGENSCYYATFLYEFAPTPNSPYSNGPLAFPLVIRFGFNINY